MGSSVNRSVFPLVFGHFTSSQSTFFRWARHSGVVGRKIASGPELPMVPQQIPRLISHFCSNGVDVCFAPNQFQAQPMVLATCMIPQQNGCIVVLCDEHVNGAVVVKIADGHSAAGERARKNWPALRVGNFLEGGKGRGQCEKGIRMCE